MKNFDLTHLMLDLKFDQIGFVEIFRHWPSIQEEDINPQRFRGHFMSQQLDSTTAWNKHDSFLGPLQYGITYSLSTGNLTGRNIAPGKDPSNLGRRSWQNFRGQGKASMIIDTFYRTVPPSQGRVPGSLYSWHLTCFNTTYRIICPRKGLLNNLKE